MKPVVLRFVALAVLFAAWMLYLVYQVVHLPPSPNGLYILSRPQFLVSQLDVVGEIEDEERPADPPAAGLALGPAFAATLPKVHDVKITQVLYSPDRPLQPGATVGVTNFRECRIPPDKPETEPAKLPEKLSSLGQVLLPLRSLDGGLTWEVVPLPPSPGFAGRESPRIYPADAETLAQYRQIGK
jgi:hypothetical protein